MISYIWITLLILGLIVFWGTNLFGLPGNWLMVLTITIWAFYVTPDLTTDISWVTVIICTCCAGLGELLEFGASILGAKKAGGSRRAAIMSVAGSIVGGIGGAILGIPIPIPIVGMVVGSILFACVGAMVGATLGEKWQGSDMDASIKVGGAAFVGRLVGTLAKIGTGAIILGVSISSLFL